MFCQILAQLSITHCIWLVWVTPWEALTPFQEHCREYESDLRWANKSRDQQLHKYKLTNYTNTNLQTTQIQINKLPGLSHSDSWRLCWGIPVSSIESEEKNYWLIMNYWVIYLLFEGYVIFTCGKMMPSFRSSLRFEILGSIKSKTMSANLRKVHSILLR